MANPELVLGILTIGFAYLWSNSKERVDRILFKYLFLGLFLITAAYVYLIDYRIYGTHTLTVLVGLAVFVLIIAMIFDIITLLKGLFENLQFK
jgi:peptidoglycan/LPS O-acetylase OafA/YrhL